MAENGRRKRGGRVALEQSSGRNVEPFLQYLETWRILGRQFALGKVNPEDRGAGRGGGGEKEKRGEELETEEGGEVGLRSRRKSWLITSLQRDDRFPTSRGERERKTDRERERGQPRSSTPALQLVATTLHASRSSSRLYTGGIRYTLLRLAVFYDQLRADSECLCKPAKPFGFKLSGIFYHFFPFFLFCLLSLSLSLHFPTTTTTLKRKKRRNCRQTTKDFLLSNEILLGANILFGDKTSSFPFLHLLLSRLED